LLDRNQSSEAPSDVAVGEVLQELLPSTLGAWFEVGVEHLLGEVGQAEFAREDLLTEIALPAGVALASGGCKLPSFTIFAAASRARARVSRPPM
jgi:hypothetical protein